MHVFENRLFQSREKLNIRRLTECSTLNPHNYWLSNGRSIKDKNLKSEIETPTDCLPASAYPTIKDKNLKSEIETAWKFFDEIGIREVYRSKTRISRVRLKHHARKVIKEKNSRVRLKERRTHDQRQESQE